MQKQNQNLKKCRMHMKCCQTRTSAHGTTSLARLVLVVAVMLAIHSVAAVLAVLVTSLKHSLVAVHHSVAVVGNGNNRVRLVVKM